MNIKKSKTKNLNYTHIKLYKSSRYLLKTITELIVNFQREYKYTIGQDLHKSIIEFTLMLYEAYSTIGFKLQSECIRKTKTQLEKINIYIRLCCDIHLFSKERYIELMKYTQEMEQQLRGWYLSCIKKADKDNKERKNVPA